MLPVSAVDPQSIRPGLVVSFLGQKGDDTVAPVPVCVNLNMAPAHPRWLGHFCLPALTSKDRLEVTWIF
ncbi:hypothetical protein DESC_740104 [Desulfosarcina cetonica]|nr:hypothetical protein DESC_740104 [Desulfosarcina cetonica]